MSSEVETSRIVTFKTVPRDSSTEPVLSKAEELGMTIFAALDVYHDRTPHSAAMNMAIDEALLEYATDPVIRFYRWHSPALSFGYFGRFADVASNRDERDLVRRWTGGGIVFHGKDLTYSIVIPASDAAFFESSMSIYEKIHRALVDALAETGERAVVAAVGSSAGALAKTDDPGSCKTAVAIARTGISDSGYNCFANPVRADVMIDNHKVAGAAQRRTRRGLLQQGSIQGTELEDSLSEQFAQALSANCRERKVDEEILKLARELVEQKYGTTEWLRKR
jgi:lipoyl(octanoyl) transferase